MKFKWGKVDEAGLLEYLVEEKGFNLERTQRQIARLVKAKSSTTQKRMDSFFTRKPSTSSSNKRKLDAKKKMKNAKKMKNGSGKKR
jgi:flap endonuclease-1